MASGDAELLLVELAMLGVSVDVNGDRLVVHGVSRVSDVLRARLRAERDAVIALLKSRDGSMRPAEGPAKPRPDVLCLSCYGTTFVRLRNGRRSVCPECERVQPSEIAGIDSGCPCGPLEREGGKA